jgi:hypothetical protein
MDVRPNLQEHLYERRYNTTHFVCFLERILEFLEENIPFKIIFDYYWFTYMEEVRRFKHLHEMYNLGLPYWVTFVFHFYVGFCIRKTITSNERSPIIRQKKSKFIIFKAYSQKLPIFKILQHPDYPTKFYSIRKNNYYSRCIGFPVGIIVGAMNDELIHVK